MRTGSAPNFCPPEEEGRVFELESDTGEVIALEFLGLIVDGERRFGFFFEVTDDEPALSSGEFVVMEVRELDAEGQPSSFAFVEDSATAEHAAELFKQAASELYDFE